MSGQSLVMTPRTGTSTSSGHSTPTRSDFGSSTMDSVNFTFRSVAPSLSTARAAHDHTRQSIEAYNEETERAPTFRSAAPSLSTARAVHENIRQSIEHDNEVNHTDPDSANPPRTPSRTASAPRTMSIVPSVELTPPPSGERLQARERSEFDFPYQFSAIGASPIPSMNFSFTSRLSSQHPSTPRTEVASASHPATPAGSPQRAQLAPIATTSTTTRTTPLEDNISRRPVSAPSTAQPSLDQAQPPEQRTHSSSNPNLERLDSDDSLRVPESRSRRRVSSPRVVEPPHNVRDEELPHEKYHEPAFQDTFKQSKELMLDLASVLSSGSIHQEQDSTMKRLHQETLQLATFKCPSKRTVGFVGDSGVGTYCTLAEIWRP